MTDSTRQQTAPAAQETPTTNPVTCSGCECYDYEADGITRACHLNTAAGYTCSNGEPAGPPTIPGTINPSIEYRWEFAGIGQGHYYNSLTDCIQDATRASLTTDIDVIIEQFRPARRRLITIRNGKEI